MNIENLRPEIPRQGQFSLVWENCGNIWSLTFKVDQGKLLTFDYENDEFISSDYLTFLFGDDRSNKLVAVITHASQTVLMEE